jgi:hypothetical protein
MLRNGGRTIFEELEQLINAEHRLPSIAEIADPVTVTVNVKKTHLKCT